MPGNRREETTSGVVSFLTLVFSVVLLDQLSKFLALSQLSAGESVPLIPSFFHLTLVRNTGIAFGFFREHETLLFALITLSLVFLFFLGFRICRKEPRRGEVASPFLERVALALILGGAIGNWIDRLRFKAVIDFLDFRVWPVFNFADSAITIGVSLYLIILLREAKS